MKYDRVHNFSAGPSMLPLEVLEDVQKNLLNYKGTGESVMEMSHRSKEFMAIAEEAEANLRKLLDIPENYKVLFLQGGGHLQFSMVPLNLLRKSKKADYIVTGSWAKKAYKEACKFGDIKCVASSEDKNFTYIPKLKKEDFRPDADYVYICTNNTIYGTEFHEFPDTGDIPLVADMSSDFLSRDLDVSKFGLIWAGAQKNVAPAGMTIVIIRDDLIGFAPEDCPLYLDYKIHAEKDSMYNTPPCFVWYVAGEVFKYLLNNGGLDAMHEKDVRKAEKLYKAIDESPVFHGTVEKEDRSLMNVCFVSGDPDKDADFIALAKKNGMINLKGHRSVGGLRASIYNAVPEESVDALIELLKDYK